MREILFRGQRKCDKEWVEGGFVSLNLENGNRTMYIMGSFKRTNIYGVDICECFFYDEVIPETVGQFTGLTDKNGKKIFEGDIVQNTITKVPAIVRWYSEYSAFILYCKKYSRVYFLYDNDFKYIEVIGNTYIVTPTTTR